MYLLFLDGNLLMRKSQAKHTVTYVFRPNGIRPLYDFERRLIIKLAGGAWKQENLSKRASPIKHLELYVFTVQPPGDFN